MDYPNFRYRIDSAYNDGVIHNRATTPEAACEVAREECHSPGSMAQVVDLETLEVIAHFYRGESTGRLHERLPENPKCLARM